MESQKNEEILAIEKMVSSAVASQAEVNSQFFKYVDEIMQQLKKLTEAFPANDPDSHRRYHEAIIEQTAEKRRLRIAIQEKTISALLWSGIVAIFTFFVQHLTTKGGN